MPCVPVSLDALLVLFASCFTAPSFRTFQALVVGQVSQTGLRTVTGMLVGSRLSGVWHHCRCHRFFSHSRWSVDELGLRLAALVVEQFQHRAARAAAVGMADRVPRVRGARRGRRHALTPAGSEDPRLLLAPRRDREQRPGCRGVG